MTLSLIGLASCWGAQDRRCDLGPVRLQQLQIEQALTAVGIEAHWQAMIYAAEDDSSVWQRVADACQRLADITAELKQKEQAFCVYGGDHSSAIGTWSGVRHAMQEPLGLIWIDAHMDSHTAQTSHSGAMHGMPLACLLGHGDEQLIHLHGAAPTLKPEHVCVIGARSYEDEEQQLLAQLGVRVFDIEECNNKGLDNIFQQALSIVATDTAGYGISLDLDAIDPTQAPGVGSPSAGGLDANELMSALRKYSNRHPLLGLEIAELNPSRDINDITAKLALEITKSCYG
jgi:arginase